MQSNPVSILFSRVNTVYNAFPSVDLWPAHRDARLYNGPNPIVAHPPCARWAKYSTRGGNQPGRDDRCAESAVRAVRRWGGVLEHPEHSGIYDTFLMAKPGTGHDLWNGWSVRIDQRAYGHRSLKPTWLYFVHVPRRAFQPLTWPGGDCIPVERLGHAERETTPLDLARLLVQAARMANPPGLGVSAHSTSLDGPRRPTINNCA